MFKRESFQKITKFLLTICHICPYSPSPKLKTYNYLIFYFDLIVTFWNENTIRWMQWRYIYARTWECSVDGGLSLGWFCLCEFLRGHNIIPAGAPLGFLNNYVLWLWLQTHLLSDSAHLNSEVSLGLGPGLCRRDQDRDNWGEEVSQQREDGLATPREVDHVDEHVYDVHQPVPGVYEGRGQILSNKENYGCVCVKVYNEFGVS